MDSYRRVRLAAALAAVGATTAIVRLLEMVIRRHRHQRDTEVSREGSHGTCWDKENDREVYINSILQGSDINCMNQIHIRKLVFHQLCTHLKTQSALRESKYVSLEESVVMFLHILGHNVRFWVIGSRFFRSTHTAHYHFNRVLRAVLKQHKCFIRSPANGVPPQILGSSRFYPYFKDCIGVIDGTHIRASVPLQMQAKYRGRKIYPTQNVLAAVTFDLKFTYVLAGWEGSAHDARILADALSRHNGLKISEGKYYLGDAGFGIQKGVLTPYRGVRYHLNEFGNDNPPQNEKELFNLHHSSLRTSVERAFGILKKRFRVLDAVPYWSYDTQVDVVLACCVLHNFIMGVDPSDTELLESDHDDDEEEEESRVDEPEQRLTQREERAENREWARKRDEIAQTMWEDYVSEEFVDVEI